MSSKLRKTKRKMRPRVVISHARSVEKLLRKTYKGGYEAGFQAALATLAKRLKV